MEIWSQSLGKEVEPEKVPLEDLICILHSIHLETNEFGDFLSNDEIEEKYAVIDEAIRRLKKEDEIHFQL